jgi:hypothetical protein
MKIIFEQDATMRKRVRRRPERYRAEAGAAACKS